MQLTYIGNDEVKWETTTKWNIGAEANLFNNRLSVALDAYYHRTNDLLTLKNFDSPVSGINQYWSNGGTLDNKGVEVKLSGKPVMTKDFTMELGASVGHYANELKSLPGRSYTDGAKTFTNGDYAMSVFGDNNILVAQGEALGQFYGYQTAGVFATEAEAANASNGHYLYMVDNAGNQVKFQAGDVHFVDHNNDGIINELDKVVIGNPNPDLYGNIFANLTYKRFTLNAGFNFSLGNDVYNYQRSILNSGSNFYNQQWPPLTTGATRASRPACPA